MNVRELEFEGFFSHIASKLVLPERGLVLITGPNGAGKSAIVEAPAYAFWGRTLRGTPPWKEGRAGRVRVLADIGEPTRKVTAKGTKSTTWVPPSAAAPAVYDTATKASDAISRAAGDMEAWRRCHVFSSRDGSNFTEATDAARKELLEGLLGLSCFDRAWDRCRADLRTAELNLQVQTANVAKIKQERAAVEAGLKALDNQAVEPEPIAPGGVFDQAAYDEITREEQRLMSELRAAQNRRLQSMAPPGLSDLEKAVGRRDGELRVAQRHLTLCQQGTCSACHQPIDEKHRLDAIAAVKEAEIILAAAFEELSELKVMANQMGLEEAATVRRFEELLNAAQTERVRLSQSKIVYDTWVRQHAAWDGRMQARAKQVQELELRWQAADDALFDAQVDEKTLELRVAELKAVSEVLGLKGVRSTVLGTALSGIETVANLYLGQISQRPTALRLRPYSETASGTVQDKISLEVIGEVGGGYGYRASSGGERRRIDASLVLALAEMNAAASGREPGTIWMDEVFDALDEAGVEAVCTVLEELAADRVVVVISHSETVISRLPAVMRVRVEDGQLV